MSIPGNKTTHASHASPVAPIQGSSYLSRPGQRIGYDVAGDGSLVVLVPGMGDLRASYRFLAPALRAAGYRVACTDLRGHGDSDNTLTSYGDEETAAEALGWSAVVVGTTGRRVGGPGCCNSHRPGLRPGPGRAVRPQLPKRDAASPVAGGHGTAVGGRVLEVVPVGGYAGLGGQLISASIVTRSWRACGGRVPFSRTTRTSHDPCGSPAGRCRCSRLVVMGEQDPDFPDPQAGRRTGLPAPVRRMNQGRTSRRCADSGYYPQSQRPTSPPPPSCASWNRSTAVP